MRSWKWDGNYSWGELGNARWRQQLLEMSVFIKHLRTLGDLRRNIQNVEKF
jgi:hypothetical protein